VRETVWWSRASEQEVLLRLLNRRKVQTMARNQFRYRLFQSVRNPVVIQVCKSVQQLINKQFQNPHTIISSKRLNKNIKNRKLNTFPTNSNSKNKNQITAKVSPNIRAEPVAANAYVRGRFETLDLGAGQAKVTKLL
jgi:hypothetical protein